MMFICIFGRHVSAILLFEIRDISFRFGKYIKFDGFSYYFLPEEKSTKSTFNKISFPESWESCVEN
jgi:hypothetical protein